MYYVSLCFVDVYFQKKELDGVAKRVADLEKFATESKKKLSESEKLIAEQQITLSQQSLQLFEQELKIEKLSKLIEDKPVALVETDSSSKNFRTLKRKQMTQKIRKPKKLLKRKCVPDAEVKQNESCEKKLKTQIWLNKV